MVYDLMHVIHQVIYIWIFIDSDSAARASWLNKGSEAKISEPILHAWYRIIINMKIS